MNKSVKPYHHGNLKEALVCVFINLLQNIPFEKLSLRRIASEVGVAPTAVYNHFKNKEELQFAAKVKCLVHFAQYLDDSVLGATSPEQKICELGKAYYRYSKEHGLYFEFMMSTKISEEYITEDFIKIAMRAEEALRIAVIELYEKHNIPTNMFNEGLGTFGCWAIAHGISELTNKSLNLAACHSGRWAEEFLLQDEGQTNACFEAMTQVLVEGLLAVEKSKMSK